MECLFRSPQPAWTQGHFISLAFSSRRPTDPSSEGVGLVEEPLPVEAGLGSRRLREEAAFHCEGPWSLDAGTSGVQLPELCAARALCCPGNTGCRGAQGASKGAASRPGTALHPGSLRCEPLPSSSKMHHPAGGSGSFRNQAQAAKDRDQEHLPSAPCDVTRLLLPL